MSKSSLSLLATYILLFHLSALSCSADKADPKTTIELEYNSHLTFEDNGALDSKRDAIEFVVRETLSLVNAKMSVENLKIRFKNDPSNTIPEIGIGGYNPNKQEVLISTNIGFDNLDQSIASELGPLLAHEIHHLKRRRTVGYGNTLLEACVSEGLADCFAMEVFDIDPPMWAVALSTNELENWTNTAQKIWNNDSYNHFNWFLGASTEIPRWTGYSIGFKLVKDYIANNPEQTPSTLHNESANSFAK